MAAKKPEAHFLGGSGARGEVSPGIEKAFRVHADGTAEELPVDQPIAEYENSWLWLHLNLADPKALETLGSLAELPASARESLLGSDDHQQLHSEPGCIYGVFADIVRANADLEIGFIRFAMTERLFVSVGHRFANAGDVIHQALQKGRKLTTVAAFLEALAARVIDAVEDYTADLAQSLNDVEERILADEVSDERRTLGRMRRTAVQLHRQLEMSRLLIRRLERDDFLPPKSVLRPNTNKLDQRIGWLDTEIVALRDRTHLLQEEVTLKFAERTNRHVEVLSIVATVFLPASLVAGVFGMNVKGLPLTQTDYGFAASIALIFGVSAAVFWLLRRSGVIGH
jgi:zinc transporter